MGIRERVKRIENEIAEFEKWKKQMECPHNDVEYIFSGYAGYRKRCKECGKSLGFYTEKEMLEERLKKAQEETKSLQDKLQLLPNTDKTDKKLKEVYYEQ